MNERRKVTLSKRLSYVLRHAPHSIGVALDEAGWTSVGALLAALAAAGAVLTREELAEIVETSPKKRFAFSPDGARIRASQGHTAAVDLGYEPKAPPPILYHGTHAAALASILASGLEPRGRHHVHLSADIETATTVGGRRGTPILLEVDACAMHGDGRVFFVSANGVWLTEAVPPRFLKVLPRRQS